MELANGWEWTSTPYTKKISKLVEYRGRLFKCNLFLRQYGYKTFAAELELSIQSTTDKNFFELFDTHKCSDWKRCKNSRTLASLSKAYNDKSLIKNIEMGIVVHNVKL